MQLFFFQAEDGIRDKLVTGVQTCALPIFVVVPLLIRLVPLPRLLSLPCGRAGGGLAPERVARLVVVAARYVPGAHCLPVALVTAWLLTRQGTPATLRLRVARHAGRLVPPGPP